MHQCKTCQNYNMLVTKTLKSEKRSFNLVKTNALEKISIKNI